LTSKPTGLLRSGGAADDFADRCETVEYGVGFVCAECRTGSVAADVDFVYPIAPVTGGCVGVLGEDWGGCGDNE
jgi:hypothetical protein